MDTLVASAGSNPATSTEPVIPPGMATTKECSFFFRTDKIRDDDGKVLAVGRKHPDVKGPVPIPTYVRLIEALQAGGKTAEFILESVVNEVDKAARQQINEWRENNPDIAATPTSAAVEKNFTATNFDLAKLDIDVIALTPARDRAGAAISDDDWTAFLEDYKYVMVSVVGYEEKKVKLAMMHFKVQLRRIKNDKPAVQKLQDLLNVYATKTENLEDHQACYEDLTKRAAKYLKAEEKNVAEAL